MSKKKLAEHIRFPDLKNPSEFALEEVTNQTLKPEKDILSRIIQTFKTGVINYEDSKALKLEQALALANQGNQEAIYLFELSQYLVVWMKINNRINQKNIANAIDIQINPPRSNNALVKYYFAYLTGFVADLNKKIDKTQFLNLIDIFKNLDNKEIKKNVLNIIKMNLSDLEITFYLSSSVCHDLLKAIKNKMQKEELSLIINSVNSNYFFKILSRFTHEIPQSVVNFYETKAPIPKAFIDGAAKNELTAWPQITIPAEKNFLDSSEVTIAPHKKLSVNDLLRFTTHLMIPSLNYFLLTGSSFTEAQLKKLNEDLKRYLIEKELLNSAGQRTLRCIYNAKLDSINPTRFKDEVNNFLQARFIKPPWTRETIDNLIQRMCEAALNAKKTLHSLSFFNSINALSLVIQILEHEPMDSIIGIEDFFFSELGRRTIASKLQETLLIAYKAFVTNRDFQDNKQKHQAFFDLAVLIVDNQITSPDFNGLILQSGDPIKHKEINTRHAFYVIIKKFHNQFTINIVNGGSNPDQDPVYESYDQGYGGFWLCRTFSTQNCAESVKIFLTHYVYRVISLRYTVTSDEADFNMTLDNIYLKNDKFIGHPQVTSYELLKSNNFDNLITIAAGADSPSFPSQTIDNCTIHNLKQAIKIFFNWAEHQLSLFTNDLFCRYNLLLKHHSASGIIALTEADQSSAKEVAQDGETLMENEDRQGKMSSPYSIKYSDSESSSILLLKSTEIDTPKTIDRSISKLICDYADGSASKPEASTNSYTISPTTAQFFNAGVVIGNYIISPTIHYFNDKVNSLNQEKSFFQYYYEQFSFNNLGKSAAFSVVFYALPNSFSVANKIIISKLYSDALVSEVYLSKEYATSVLSCLVFSYGSFYFSITGKQNEYYLNYPLAVGALVSTIDDIMKLSYDTGYYLMGGESYSSIGEEL